MEQDLLKSILGLSDGIRNSIQRDASSPEMR